MAYRDPERENLRALTQANGDVNFLSIKKELSSKNYDFVSRSGNSKKDRLLSATRKVRDRERDWQLLGHLQNKDNCNSPINYPDDDSLELEKFLSVPTRRGSDLDPDFYMLSGKFKVDDNNKLLAITQRVRDKCEEKFWRTHDYNCIKAKSYDPKLQEQFVRENQAIEKSQGLLQASKYPHW